MKMQAKTDACIICGSEFETVSGHRAYCSPKCRLRAYRLRYNDKPYEPPATVVYRERVLSMLGRKQYSWVEIARRLGIGRKTVELIAATSTGDEHRTVTPYRCQGCEDAGVYWVTNLKPCVRCRARSGK